MPSEKLCVFCTHFYLSRYSPGYSEYTPGSEANISCWEGRWGKKDLTSLASTEEFRALILTAATCPDYEPAVERKPL